MKNLLNMIYILTLLSIVSCSQNPKSIEEINKLKFVETFNADKPNLKIIISLFKSPAVDEPIETTGFVEIKHHYVGNNSFNLNLKDGYLEMKFPIVFQKKKDGKYYYLEEIYDTLGGEGGLINSETVNIELEPTSVYPNCDVIVYFMNKGDREDVFVVGKTIYE